jgi:hypothetical protein
MGVSAKNHGAACGRNSAAAALSYRSLPQRERQVHHDHGEARSDSVGVASYRTPAITVPQRDCSRWNGKMREGFTLSGRHHSKRARRLCQPNTAKVGNHQDRARAAELTRI